MKRQVLFIQGAGARVHDEWDDKLAESLTRELGPQYDVQYPRMPDEDDPHVAAWKAALTQHLESLHDGAIVVGHSVGGTVLINTLAEKPPARLLGAIVLIAAPFVGADGWESDEWQSSGDLGAQLPRGAPICVFHGLADDTVPPSHADLYARAIPQARLYRLTNRDHQLNNDLREIAQVIKTLAPRE